MNQFDRALGTLRAIEESAKTDRWVNRIHPLVKLFLTILYIALVVSFHKYALIPLLLMAVYPIAVFVTAELSFLEALYRLRIVLPIVCVVGVFNPFFDRRIVAWIGGVAISGGVLSMLSLMAKAVFSVLASYLLVVTTPIEEICYALRRLHLPQILVVEILLIYRYLSVFIGEVHRVSQAYRLRAPGQRGIAKRAWGSFLGRILLGAMDRAGLVYESMCVRGFDGTFHFAKKRGFGAKDVLYLALWTAVLLAFRFLPLAGMIGGAVVA